MFVNRTGQGKPILSSIPIGFSIISIIVLTLTAGCLILTDETDASPALSGKCGTNLDWTFDPDTGNLTITGTGDMYTYYTEKPWDSKEVKNVSLPDGLTSISRYMFSESKLSSVDIPGTVTSIGNMAFLYSKNLRTVSLHEGLETIGDSCFTGCESLESIDLPDSLTTIGSFAFNECSSLRTLTIPDGVTEFGQDAFFGINFDWVIVGANCHVHTYNLGFVIKGKQVTIDSDGLAAMAGTSHKVSLEKVNNADLSGDIHSKIGRFPKFNLVIEGLDVIQGVTVKIKMANNTHLDSFKIYIVKGDELVETEHSTGWMDHNPAIIFEPTEQGIYALTAIREPGFYDTPLSGLILIGFGLLVAVPYSVYCRRKGGEDFE